MRGGDDPSAISARTLSKNASNGPGGFFAARRVGCASSSKALGRLKSYEPVHTFTPRSENPREVEARDFSHAVVWHIGKLRCDNATARARK